ncbi:CIC11C00000000807 [Sungouiella intermedia]|uniref:CIC11C00000000807 n=1 Tax=Sungouiella intermedia TaxID=45354 RepID=A0A1L0BNL1_9ASCO|nr:CIC11C00000000807 [[Candida] intermedia]
MEYLTELDPADPGKATRPILPGLTWTEPVEYWDFHVYYDDKSRDESNALKKRLLADFPEYASEGAIIVKQLPVEKAIGPHYDLFWEVDVARVDVFAKLLSWFVQHHGSLSVLVHPQTGFDLKDHTEHALWLGEKKELKTFVFPNTPTEIPPFGVRRQAAPPSQ